MNICIYTRTVWIDSYANFVNKDEQNTITIIIKTKRHGIRAESCDMNYQYPYTMTYKFNYKGYHLGLFIGTLSQKISLLYSLGFHMPKSK
jgi:hypothetical protein